MREKRKLLAVRLSIVNDAEIFKKELGIVLGIEQLSWSQFFVLLLNNKEKIMAAVNGH